MRARVIVRAARAERAIRAAVRNWCGDGDDGGRSVCDGDGVRSGGDKMMVLLLARTNDCASQTMYQSAEENARSERSRVSDCAVSAGRWAMVSTVWC